jgi:hypothetical protein
MRKSIEPYLHSGEELLNVTRVQARGAARVAVRYSGSSGGANEAAYALRKAELDAEAEASSGDEIKLSMEMGLAVTSRRFLIFMAKGLFGQKVKKVLADVPIRDVQSIQVGKGIPAKPITLTIRGEQFEMEAATATNTDKLVRVLEAAVGRTPPQSSAHSLSPGVRMVVGSTATQSSFRVVKRGRDQAAHDSDDQPTEFGCARCYGADARASWTYCAEHLTIERALVDDAHFIVQLRRCPTCSQRFVWILTETVDWVGGDDGQYRNVVPVTTAEAQMLARREDIDAAVIEPLGRNRRFLQVDWPTGQRDKNIRWTTGKLVITPGS